MALSVHALSAAMIKILWRHFQKEIRGQVVNVKKAIAQRTTVSAIAVADDAQKNAAAYNAII